MCESICIDREIETDIDLNVYVCLYISITFLASHCHLQSIFPIYFPKTPFKHIASDYSTFREILIWLNY